MIDPLIIGLGGPVNQPLCCYLGWDQNAAMADWHLRVQGSIEPTSAAADWQIADVRQLSADAFFPTRTVITGQRIFSTKKETP